VSMRALGGRGGFCSGTDAASSAICYSSLGPPPP
jgi:hypothetical protein